MRVEIFHFVFSLCHSVKIQNDFDANSVSRMFGQQPNECMSKRDGNMIEVKDDVTKNFIHSHVCICYVCVYQILKMIRNQRIHPTQAQFHFIEITA